MTSSRRIGVGDVVTLCAMVGADIGVVTARIVLREQKVDEDGNVEPEFSQLQIRWDDNEVRNHQAFEVTTADNIPEFSIEKDDFDDEQDV